jgi:DNA-binding NtrC family response regulator
MYCGYCGRKNLDEHSYCLGCGKPLEALSKNNITSNNDPGSSEIDYVDEVSVTEIHNILSKLKNIQPDSLSSDIPEGGINLKQYIEDFEKSILLKSLDKTKWNKKKAAELLGLNRTTLVEKLKKYGMMGK